MKVANKAKLHHLWRIFFRSTRWYLLIMTILVSLIAVFALRDNNLKMVRLRQAVFDADKNNTDVAAALAELRDHVYGHMNTDLNASKGVVGLPLQLKYSFERAQAAEKKRVIEANAQVSLDAQKQCEAENPNGFSGGGRVSCNEEYVATYGVKETPVPEEAYTFNFASPTWSPDLAGWAIVVAVGLAISTIGSFLIDRWVRRQLAEHS